MDPAEEAKLLAAVAEATDARESAAARQLAAIRAAVDAGVPIARIARSAGFSREYIYKLIG